MSSVVSLGRATLLPRFGFLIPSPTGGREWGSQVRREAPPAAYGCAGSSCGAGSTTHSVKGGSSLTAALHLTPTLLRAARPSWARAALSRPSPQACTASRWKVSDFFFSMNNLYECSCLIPEAVAVFYACISWDNLFSFHWEVKSHIYMDHILHYANTYFVFNVYGFKWLFI